MPTAPTPMARTRRAVVLTAVLSVALTAGLALSAVAAPTNPLVPEVATPEMHPAPRIEKKLDQLQEAYPSASTPVPASAPDPRAAEPVPAKVTLALPQTSSSFAGFAFPGCASAGRPATVLAAVRSKKTRTLRWVLTNGGGVNKTGRLRVKGSKSKVTEFSVTGVPVGPYRLDFYKSGKKKLSVRVPVLVLTCIQATATCRGITFTNPTANPAVELDYGPADDNDEGDGGFFLLAPGKSRSIRTDSARVAWSAYSFTATTQSSAGEADSLAVPQVCTPPAPVPGDNSLVSYGLADCRRAGATRAQFELGFERLRDIAVRFEVVNSAGVVVLHGTATASNEAVGALPGPGAYRYRTYLNGATTAYEDVPFTVLDCVRVQRTCKTVIFTNPNAARIEVAYATKTGKHERELALAGKRATTVSWKYKDLSWFAYPGGAAAESDELGPEIFSLAGEGSVARPSGC